MRDFGIRSASKFNPKVRANEQIRSPQIRLIGPSGTQEGIVSVKDALLKAQEEGLDLVEVAPQAKPPVCRIMDLGKYLYTLSKKEKESRRKQKVVYIKEIKMSPKIEEHDYQTKLRQSRNFVGRGDKVKLTMFFRGREITHAELGRKIVKRFTEDMSDIAGVEKDTGLDGRAIHVYYTGIQGGKKSPARKKNPPSAEHQPSVPKAENSPPAES